MADMNDIKNAVINTIGTVAGKTRDLAEKAADKAKDVTLIAKLNMGLNTEKDTIQKAYLEIGKLYYETRKNSPEGFFSQLCDEITLASENIAKIESKIDELKLGDCKCGKNSDFEVEFTDITEEEAKAPEAADDDFVKHEEKACWDDSPKH
ncbi:MAG: hypothetical protein RSD32_06635 [Oscillospiraceae bacterium]